ncbi:MAG: hypothetical protein JW709_07020 [Sedimentisphaerales bacterium]|nr:hypothetical protein [Sedimentisphaerales bacterium]
MNGKPCLPAVWLLALSLALLAIIGCNRTKTTSSSAPLGDKDSGATTTYFSPPTYRQVQTISYEDAVRGDPNNARLWCNWGFWLFNKALKRDTLDKDTVYTQAYAKFQQATLLDPTYTLTWFYWGEALTSQALTKQGPPADVLFAASYEKFRQATTLDPRHCMAWSRWSYALKRHAATKQGPEQEALWQQIQQTSQRAKDVCPDIELVIQPSPTRASTFYTPAATRSD